MILRIRLIVTAARQWICRTLGNVKRLVPFFTHIRQQTGTAWRSSALHPLILIFGLLLAAIVLSLPFKILVMSIFLGVLACAVLAVILVMFCIWGSKDPNLLRSEKYNMLKAAMEIYGDNQNGLILESTVKALLSAEDEKANG
jgi:hypothetical protein